MYNCHEVDYKNKLRYIFLPNKRVLDYISLANVTEQAGPQGATASPSVSNLGVNEPGKATTAGPFTGKDVSMTSGQYAGGNITTTEVGSK